MNQRFDVYAAGLVDGEGCITAKATKSGTGMGIRVVVGMATKATALLERMLSVYGGTLITQSPKNPKHSDVITWTATGATAAAMLRRIEPHLILKTEQAQLALRIEEIRTSLPQIGDRDHHKWTPEALARCQTIYRRIHELNERGPFTTSPTPSGAVPLARYVAGTWVTDQADLFSDLGWEPFTQTWPRSGCMFDGRAFERPTLVPRITESDCSSLSHLPTPRASDPANVSSHASEGFRPQLGEVLRTFPTPTASLGEHRNDNGQDPQKRRDSGHQASLADVTCYLPTPEAKNGSAGPDYARANRKNSGADDLVTAVDRLIKSTGDHTGTLFDVGNE